MKIRYLAQVLLAAGFVAVLGPCDVAVAAGRQTAVPPPEPNPNVLNVWVPVVGGSGPAAGHADSISLVSKSAARPGGASSTAKLALGRGESQGFQLVLAKRTGGYTNVNVSVSPPVDRAGHQLRVDVYLQRYKRINLPSFRSSVRSSVCESGAFGDPCYVPSGLVPAVRVDGNANSYVRGWTVPSDENQPYWIDVHALRGSTRTPPGEYRGAVTVTATPHGAPSAKVEIPVIVTVWSFELPASPTFKSFFDVKGDYAIGTDMSDRPFAGYGRAGTRSCDLGSNYDCHHTFDPQMTDLFTEHKLSLQNAPPAWGGNERSLANWLSGKMALPAGWRVQTTGGMGATRLNHWLFARPASAYPAKRKDAPRCEDFEWVPTTGYAGPGVPYPHADVATLMSRERRRALAPDFSSTPSGIDGSRITFYVRLDDEMNADAMVNRLLCPANRNDWTATKGIPAVYRQGRAWGRYAHGNHVAVVATNAPDPETMCSQHDCDWTRDLRSQGGTRPQRPAVDFYCVPGGPGLLWNQSIAVHRPKDRSGRRYDYAMFDLDRGFTSSLNLPPAESTTPESKATSHLCVYWDSGWVPAEPPKSFYYSGHMPVWAADYPGANWRNGLSGFGAVAWGISAIMMDEIDVAIHKSNDAWSDSYDLPSFGHPHGNGQNWLMYPGSYVGAGHHAVPSIPMKWLRDGVQDFEYVEMLRRAGRYDSVAQQAVKAAGGNTTTPKAAWTLTDSPWSKIAMDPAVIANSRYVLGSKLHERR